MASSPPATILDSGIDAGNFRGVAVYDSREQVEVVSEMNAGWYRYVSEWIFRDDGVILPRFGFGGVANSCVCTAHSHHVYWRFDFDIVAANNEVIESKGGVDQALAIESMRPRTGGQSQAWIIKNSAGNERCVIVPGLSDGNFDKYSRGDVWVLQNHFPGEVDDGVNCSDSCDTTIQIDSFINGESVSGVDIVVWYGANFLHDDEDDNSEEGNHVVGPTLMVQRY
jgi:Cu2+-containing amine oxidase